MKEPDHEGAAAELDQMDMRRVRWPDVQVSVAMGHAVVRVLVSVDAEPADGAEKHVAAQEDEDQADRPLQRLLDPGGDRELEGDDGDAGAQQRERVAGAPERAEETGPDEPALARDQRRDRRHVVGVESVPETRSMPSPSAVTSEPSIEAPPDKGEGRSVSRPGPGR